MTVGIICISMDLYLKSFLYRKMPSPLSEKSNSQLQLFLSITCLLYIFSAVISRYVNASNVYAVPFTVAFWQERGSTTQSEYKIFKQAFLSKNGWDSWLIFCLRNCLYNLNQTFQVLHSSSMINKRQLRPFTTLKSLQWVVENLEPFISTNRVCNETASVR